MIGGFAIVKPTIGFVSMVMLTFGRGDLTFYNVNRITSWQTKRVATSRSKYDSLVTIFNPVTHTTLFEDAQIRPDRIITTR